MSVQDTAAFAPTTAPTLDVAITENVQQATPPMSVGFILNDSTPLVGQDQQGLPLNPISPGPSAPSTARSVPGDYVDDTMPSDLHMQQPLEEKLPVRETSPAPSTGEPPSAETAAPNVATNTVDVEMETKDNPATNGTTMATFRCMNDEFEECRTGQTTMDLSRKVISDHFGRNKACTRLVTDWPLFCRKHYQRATYNQKLWQARKISLILRQFNIIEDQFPGTKYTIALKKSEEQRLNTFSRKLAAGKSELEAAAMVAPVKGKHFEAPVNVLREIEQLNYLGEDKTKADAEETVNTIRDMLENEETEQVPSIEFLPQLDIGGSPYDARSRSKSTKKSTTRVSKKGAITKPSPTVKTPKKRATKA